MSAPLGKAPELLYEPSACNAALLNCDWPDVLADIDPQGVVHLSGVKTLNGNLDSWRRQRAIEDYLAAATVGERVRALRMFHGLRQVDVARPCGVDKSTVSHWERYGHHPRYPTLQRVAQLFDMTATQLATGQLWFEDEQAA